MIAFEPVDPGFVLLDLDEVAGRLGYTRHRIQTLIREDDLAAVLHGGRWMVAPEEVADFQRRWKPPVRPKHLRRPRRFIPPPRPGDLPENGSRNTT